MDLLLRRRMMMAQSTEVDWSKKYLTFEALAAGTFSFSTNAIYYSLDDGSTWTSLAAGSSTPTVAAGERICFKASGLTPNGNYGIGTFSATANFNAMGNVMSMQDGDNFASSTSIGADYQFRYLFNSNTYIVSAEKLVLPATTLAENCYRQMFRRCTSLTTAPELPATTLATYCYHNMFNGCSALTTAPELPATTLATQCYRAMFQNCTSLATAPELPATTLATYCYNSMFHGCTSLATAPELPATTLVDYCYYYMFMNCSSLNYIKCLATDISARNCTNDWVYGVASSGTFVKASSMSSWTTGTSGIPSGWTVQDA